MSIILSLGDRFATTVQRLLGPHSSFTNFVRDSECGGRVLDGLALWSLALVVAGVSQLTVTTKLVAEHSETHSLVATITVAALLCAFFAPMVGFFWGPTSKGGRRKSSIDLNLTVPAVSEGCQLFSCSGYLGQVVAASFIISLGGLVYLPFKAVFSWLPWTLLAIGIGMTGSQWIECNIEDRTIRRFAFFYGDSWTIEQHDLANCKGLIWGGHDLARGEHETLLVHWLTVILGGGQMIKIHSLSQLEGADINTPSEPAIQLAESLGIPLWIPRENMPIEELAAKFCDNQAETFRIWGQPSPEPEVVPTVLPKTEKSHKLVLAPDNSTEEIDLE